MGNGLQEKGEAAQRQRRALALVLVAAAAATFLPGITLPLLKLKRLFLFSDSYSLIGMVQALLGDGEWLLGLIVLVFSVLLPGAKITLLALMALAWPRAAFHPRLGHVAAHLGRWSMLDVLLVALLILAVKTSGVGTALSQPGLYFFAGSVLASMLAAALLPTPRYLS